MPGTVVGSTPPRAVGLPGWSVKALPMLQGGTALAHGVLPGGIGGAPREQRIDMPVLGRVALDRRIDADQ